MRVSKDKERFEFTIAELWILRRAMFDQVNERAEDPKAQRLFERITGRLGFPIED